MELKIRAVLLAALLVPAVPDLARAQADEALYARALAQERTVRDAARTVTLRQIRNAVRTYDGIVRRYPRSGYADNALWQAGHLSLLAYELFGEASDKRNGLRFLNLLKSEYPSSSLVGRLAAAIAQFEKARAPRAVKAAAAPPADVPVRAVEREPAETGGAADGESSSSITNAIIRAITRTPLEDGVRISIETDRELLFRQEQLENPRRVFFDLENARAGTELLDRTLTYADGVVREIRLGRHPRNMTRVVMDTEGVDSYSVFTLYNPFRVIVDFKRAATTAAAPATPVADAAAPVPTTGPATSTGPAVSTGPLASTTGAAPPPPPLPSRPAVSPELLAPAVPAVNSDGKFSLARQLGLGISRIVIDAGHGGHDPGAKANGLTEADLTLDVALRLKKLLIKQPGVEVVMTRQTDVYIPLEERTAIANRESADLFLSIHANASRNKNARGVETYFLNFATNPEAEAVAARENSASGKTMHNLPSIVRAIALNNKIDESRDFAATVQKSMVSRLKARNKDLRDLGVKQAPFVVLIGAGMPSVLAEMSFVTNKQEGQLLKSSAYRQTIAEALFDAIVRYQDSLKSNTAIATREN